MATFTERLRIVLDLQGEKAEAGLKKVRDAMREAEGFTGKLKVGLGTVAEAFLSPVGIATGATVAATAVGKFIGDASDLGVEIGKLADATGLSTEQASRWVEIANDMGIGSENLAGLIEKMGKNIGATPDKFKELGIFLQYANDGTVDMNATMLLAVDRLNAIKDPTQRAAASASLFGKSWASASELLKMSSADITKRLDSVGDSKVFSKSAVDDARAFRDTLADLKDQATDTGIAIGKDLLPPVTLLLKGLGYIPKTGEAFVQTVAFMSQNLDALSAGSVADADAAFNTMKKTIEKTGDQFFKTKYAADNGAKSLDALWSQVQAGNVTLEGFNDAMGINAYSLKVQADKFKESRQSSFDYADGLANARDAAKGLTDAEKEQEQAQKDLDKATQDYTRSVQDLYKLQLSQLDLKEQIGKMLADWKSGADKNIDSAKNLAEKQAELQFGTLNSKAAIDVQIWTLTELEKTTKKGSPLWKAIEDHKQSLKDVEDQVLRTQAAEAGLNGQAANAAAGGAPGVFGAPVTVPNGGRGPEVVGYAVYHVNVTVSDPSPNAVINAIAAWERRNGTAWRQ